jgi:hypothetical protein
MRRGPVVEVIEVDEITVPMLLTMAEEAAEQAEAPEPAEERIVVIA